MCCLTTALVCAPVDAYGAEQLTATSTRSMRDGADTVRELAARPLRAGTLHLIGACPPASTEDIQGAGSAVIAGPAAAVVGPTPQLVLGQRERITVLRPARGWYRAKVLWLIQTDEGEPVIVRGTRIDRPGPVRWVRNGHDRTLELRGDAESTAPPEWRDVPSALLVRGEGCYALQVDGPTFESIILLRAIRQDR